MKALIFIWKFIFTLVTIFFVMIGIWFLLNGGIQSFGISIKDNGFFETIGKFFKGFYTGFRTTFGI